MSEQAQQGKGVQIFVNGIPHYGRIDLRQITGGGWSLEKIDVHPLVTPQTAASAQKA